MKILFQGDSITDGGRGDYTNCHAMGCGYPRLIEADLSFDYREMDVMNVSVTGSKITDLVARWKKDCINLKPDILTVLIGVNDVWHGFSEQTETESKLFEDFYRILLKETVSVLPECQIMLMGDYVTHGTSTDGIFDEFSSKVGEKRAITEKLAAEFNALYLDLQKCFDEACERFPTEHWTADGVHPTAAGHRLIANAWEAATGFRTY